MSYWNDLYPGYDKARGIPCCKTNERGYKCSCKDPAPIPEGQAKADPYAPPVVHGRAAELPPVYSSGLEYDCDGLPVLGRTGQANATVGDGDAPSLRDKIQELLGGENDGFDDELGPPPGLYIPRPTRARMLRDRTTQKLEALCAFEHNGGFFLAQPQRLFKPLGLMIWGAPEGATMEAAYVGNMMQLLISMGKFPAAWFAQSQNFEQIFERAKEGLVPASFGSWDTCEVGMLLRVMIESKTGASLGPQDGVQIGMWGWTTSL